MSSSSSRITQAYRINTPQLLQINSGSVFKMQNQMIISTNCYNCMWIAKKEEPVEPQELNAEGGIDPKNEEDML